MADNVFHDVAKREQVVSVRVSDAELARLHWRVTDRVVELLAERLAEALAPAVALHLRVHHNVLVEAVRDRVAAHLSDRLVAATDAAFRSSSQ